MPLPLARWLVSARDWHGLHPAPEDWRVWRAEFHRQVTAPSLKEREP